MGSTDYPVTNYGLLILERDLIPGMKDNDDELDGLTYYPEYNGTALQICKEDEGDFWPEIEERLDDGFYFCDLNFGPSIYKCKAHYNSYNDIKRELETKCSRFVGPEFPWEKRIVRLDGTSFG